MFDYHSIGVVALLVIHIIIRPEHRNGRQRDTERERIQQFVVNFYNGGSVEAHFVKCVKIGEHSFLTVGDEKQSIAVAFVHFVLVFIATT